MYAGSCGAIQGANRANSTKMMTKTVPVAASGLCLTILRNDMEAVNMLNEMLIDTRKCGGFKAELMMIHAVLQVLNPPQVLDEC
jgi:hypothetical protein